VIEDDQEIVVRCYGDIDAYPEAARWLIHQRQLDARSLSASGRSRALHEEQLPIKHT
jgi:hypothetical protein